MATVQETAIKASVNALFNREGVQITYKRGVDSVTITQVVKSELRHQGEDNEGFTVLNVKPDFLIKAADLVLSGSQVLPKIGDRIECSEGGINRVYRVSAPSPAEDCYRYSDRWFYCLRVHASYQEVI